MYFKEQQIGSSDKAIMKMTISRCIVAKILEANGALKPGYSFYKKEWLTYGGNYEQIFAIEARIETLNEAMQLLKMGKASYREIDDGVEITIIAPGIIIDDYAEFFDHDDLSYEWQAEAFLEENEEKMDASNGVYIVKFSDFLLLPHVMLQRLLKL